MTRAPELDLFHGPTKLAVEVPGQVTVGVRPLIVVTGKDLHTVARQTAGVLGCKVGVYHGS